MFQNYSCDVLIDVTLSEVIRNVPGEILSPASRRRCRRRCCARTPRCRPACPTRSPKTKQKIDSRDSGQFFELQEINKKLES